MTKDLYPGMYTCGRLQPALDRLVGRRHQGLVRRLGDPHGQVVAHRVRGHEGMLVGERHRAGQYISISVSVSLPLPWPAVLAVW